MDILELLKHPALPLITFLLGVLIGHRTALWRDRREEFNDAADPVRVWLLREIDRPSAGRAGLSLGELDMLWQCLPRWRRKGWLAAWQAQQDARAQQARRDATGQTLYADDAPIVAALRVCLGFTARR